MQGAVLQGGRAGERELSGDIRAEDRGDGLGCQRYHRRSGAQPSQRHCGALQRGRADHLPGGHGLKRGGNSAGRPHRGGGLTGVSSHGAVEAATEAG